MKARTKGLILGIVGAAAYGLNPLFTMPLYHDGMTPDNVLFWRYLLAIPAVYLAIRLKGRSVSAKPAILPHLGILGLLIALSSLWLFKSYKYMDTGIASALLFVYPIMTALIMAAFFRERLPLSVRFCVLLAVFGVFLLCRGGGEGQGLSLLGVSYVMLSSLSYSVYLVLVHLPRFRAVDPVAITFYVLVTGALLFLATSLFKGCLSLPPFLLDWGCILALALMPTLVAFWFTTEAITYIGSTITSILGALEPLTAVVCGMIFFHERLSCLDWLGILCILVSVVAVFSSGSLLNGLASFLKRLWPFGEKD